MAQSDSTPTPVREPFTGADTQRSTNQDAAAGLTRRVRAGGNASKSRLVNRRHPPSDRRYFIGGSDARIIMGDDEAALVRLWREKRDEIEPEDLSGNLIVQLGLATEDLNRRWYEANTGQVITDIQKRVWHPAHPASPPSTAARGARLASGCAGAGQ